MILKNTSIFLVCIFLFSACSRDAVFEFKTPKKISINQSLQFSVSEKNGKEIDSVNYFLDGVKVKSNLNIENKRLGIHSLTAKIYADGEEKKLNNSVYFLAETSPIIYGYEVVNSFPHDKDAFTQGFEYYNDFIYESTGLNGKSSIRKTELKTGKVLNIKKIDKKYFGEGITLFNEKIFHLTWHAKKGFIYDLESFEELGSFNYGKSIQGWGLTHNETELIKSDGTERIWFLDPETQKEKRFIEAYTNKRKAEQLNEIEYVEGKIYANIWQKNTIIIIEPKNGTIEGVVNLNGLRTKVNTTNASNDYVLNGIAYDSEKKRLFVTGKNWDKTFEIKLLPKK